MPQIGFSGISLGFLRFFQRRVWKPTNKPEREFMFQDEKEKTAVTNKNSLHRSASSNIWKFTIFMSNSSSFQLTNTALHESLTNLIPPTRLELAGSDLLWSIACYEPHAHQLQLWNGEEKRERQRENERKKNVKRRTFRLNLAGSTTIRPSVSVARSQQHTRSITSGNTRFLFLNRKRFHQTTVISLSEFRGSIL